ncbi:MAG: hypothetical protein Q7J84_15565 [Sulfuricaulis sp.]|nr:hypothetical protein [Sulfuricaulis sp.]
MLDHLGKTEADDDPLLVLTVLDICGLGDAVWCLDEAVKGADRVLDLYDRLKAPAEADYEHSISQARAEYDRIVVEARALLQRAKEVSLAALDCRYDAAERDIASAEAAAWADIENGEDETGVEYDRTYRREIEIAFDGYRRHTAAAGSVFSDARRRAEAEYYRVIDAARSQYEHVNGPAAKALGLAEVQALREALERDKG